MKKGPSIAWGLLVGQATGVAAERPRGLRWPTGVKRFDPALACLIQDRRPSPKGPLPIIIHRSNPQAPAVELYIRELLESFLQGDEKFIVFGFHKWARPAGCRLARV